MNDTKTTKVKLGGKRKGYIILYRSDDVTTTATLEGQVLPEGLTKFVDLITGADLRPMLSPEEQVQRKHIHDSEVFALITRRAPARRIVQLMRERRVHGHDQFKLLEVGDFNRNVRPVKHWNIFRSKRLIGKGNKWEHDVMPYARGIKLRDEARTEAAGYTDQWASRFGAATYEYKFTAKAVYA